MSTAAPELPGRPENLARPRWHRIYFWLAAFDVLTVSLSLLLSHLLTGIYTEFVDQNERWFSLLEQSSKLGGLAARVNEPGNAVFETLQVQVEQANMRKALAAFDQEMRDFEDRLREIAEGDLRRRLQHQLAILKEDMKNMTGHALIIFAEFERNRPRANEAMPRMDREHHRINAALTTFRDEVGKHLTGHFKAQRDQANRYRSFEFAIAGGILLMVGGATFYGHQLARQAAAHTQALRESEFRLEQRVRERTAELEQANVALRDGEERYRHLAKQVLTAQEDERRRIARDLHDEIGQSLTYFLIGLRTVEQAPSVEAARERLGELRQVATQTLDEVRRLARGLRPSVLDDLGLGPALERYAEEYAQAHGIPVTLRAPALAERLPEEVETTLYRIVQEALTNTARHAQARQVCITAERTPGTVAVTVADDGRGFSSSGILTGQTSGRHQGLSGMCERAGLVNGTVRIDSRPGAGTTVRVTLPLAETKHGEDSRSPGG